MISELRKEHTLCRHGGNPTGQLYKKQTLNKEKSFQDSDHGRASDSRLVGRRKDNQITVRSSYKCCSMA